MSKFTTIERQYIKGIVQNLSLQRFTDQDIVNYLYKAKGIEITKAMVNKVRNRQEQEATGWYIELKESGHKLISFYKDRLDSLLSYQQKLNLILLDNQDKSDTRIRAIAELHRIEMSIFTLLKEFPEFNIESESSNTHTLERCNCPTSDDRITHSKCRYCHQVWCATTLNQDWCPNPDCSQGIKGNQFEPWDEHNKWIKCPTCEMWFKNTDILAVHNCFIKVVPGIGDEDSLPGIGGDGAGPRVEEPSTNNEPEPEIITPPEGKPFACRHSSPIEEQTETEIEEEETLHRKVALINEEEEPEETEADKYWRAHPSRVRPTNNNKVKFVIE